MGSQDLRPGGAGAGLGEALPPPPLLPTAVAVEVVAAEELYTYRSHSRPSRSYSRRQAGAMGALRRPGHEDGGGGSGVAARARLVPP